MQNGEAGGPSPTTKAPPSGHNLRMTPGHLAYVQGSDRRVELEATVFLQGTKREREERQRCPKGKSPKSSSTLTMRPALFWQQGRQRRAPH